MNAQKNGRAHKANSSGLAADIKPGDVVFVAGACLPYVLITGFEPNGLWEGEDGSRPMYVGYCMEQLGEFTVRDRECGLPRCHLVRDAQWMSRDSALTDEGDMVVTDHVFYLLECMLERAEVAGRVSNDALAGISHKLQDFSALSLLSDEDWEVRMGLRSATLVALDQLLEEL